MVYRLTGDKYSDTMIYNIAFVYNGAIWLDNERGRVILDTISNAKNPTMEAGDGMLHILLCDDDAIFTEALKRLIEAQPEFNRRYMQIECVHDPNALKKAAVQKADMIFLDIDMGDVNGIALARQIRTIRKDAVLIFVTNYGEYAAEGYEVSAFRFLPKLQLAEKLPDYFRQALAACRSRTRTLNVLCDGEGTNIVLDELVYVGTEERMLIFHRAEPAAPLKSRMSLRTLEEKLAEEGFLRIHNSFLVNMSYIAALRTWLLTKLWDSFFTRRFNGKQFWAYWLLWTAIITVVLNVLPNDYDYSNIIRFLIEIAHEYAMNLMLYRSRWDRRLFVVITGYACFLSISVLPEKAWLLYSGMTRTEYVYNKPLYTAFIFLRGLCLVAFVILVRHFHTPPQENGKPRAWIPASTLFPLCTLFVLYRVFNAEGAAGENDAWTFCLLVMCAVDMVALFLLDQLESTAQMREALAVAHQRVEVQSANVKALGNSYKAQRKMTHEFRGYLFALSDMLANGDTEAAQSYLDELKVRQTERILLVNTHNPIIDAILNQKGYAAREQDIDLHFEINDLSEVAIPSVDLTVVMSNLLDNAIEACEKLEKQQRRMTVKAIYNKSDNPPTLFFSVKNASKPVKIFGDHIPTTKPEPELHGFGLPNVMDILHKYDVFYLMDYKDGSFLFCLEWADAANEKAVAAAQK